MEQVAVIEGVIHMILAMVLRAPDLDLSTQVAALVVSLPSLR